MSAMRLTRLVLASFFVPASSTSRPLVPHSVGCLCRATRRRPGLCCNRRSRSHLQWQGQRDGRGLGATGSGCGRRLLTWILQTRQLPQLVDPLGVVAVAALERLDGSGRGHFLMQELALWWWWL
ncbi:hypothetical protein CAOG_009534 [Capsaspora owczarzaki ATCC 30864]|uniref:Secreted protein n=1 Tax=Capsaspora owczarzaki (strain ATCC 30864) TaxID=595528 RepID=A0A0D2WM60_CAPO3|nr:hypothetical protein CAOG_009534 [Capsaspora owczarzaki ATCC 30864]